MRQLTTASALQAKAQPNANILADRAAHRLANFMPIFILKYLPAVPRSCPSLYLASGHSPSFLLTCDVSLGQRLTVLCFYFLDFFFFFVATLMAFPFLLGFGSFLLFLLAAVARFFLPMALALANGRHFGLPSLSERPPHEPLIFPSGPIRTHFCLNHFLRSSLVDSEMNSYALILLLFRFVAPVGRANFSAFC